MITNHDRSGYIGASDVSFVIGNWKTKTWEKWWLIKLGINQDHFSNEYTDAGTHWEHRILKSLDLPDLELDRQIIIEDLRLRINLDGNTHDRIKECKTYKEYGISGTVKQLKQGICPTGYRNQVQVQIFGTRLLWDKPMGADLVTYALIPEDYINYMRAIDPGRRREITVDYDPVWIEKVYLPKHRILAECLRKGVFPDV